MHVVYLVVIQNIIILNLTFGVVIRLSIIIMNMDVIFPWYFKIP